MWADSLSPHKFRGACNEVSCLVDAPEGSEGKEEGLRRARQLLLAL